ncbi:putative integral membrane protein [Babesia bovis T2Bo]|uniref:putative integral membrane protein n=1 Tax=Babesia bovis T2Bo TaxID=484906 RepID=UPI001C35A70B|nr:putative integral membrane protein [Babesia bovis T2Bo]KAG6440088.1 putative integral membrane protein [Babesia bovis T2Bo]
MASQTIDRRPKPLFRALNRLEQTLNIAFDSELKIQRRARLIALVVLVSSVASLVHVIRSLIHGLEKHREVAKESWTVRYVPTVCFAAFLYFFKSTSFRRSLFCSTIYLERLNFSLLDFNLRFCSKSKRLEFIQ